MPSLHSIIMVAIAAAGCSPIGKLVDAILAHLLALVTPELIKGHAKRLNRGRPRISLDAPKIKGCLADDPNVDRALLGFALNAHGIEANPDRWLRLMRAARSATGWYWFRAPSGKWRRVKCRTFNRLLPEAFAMLRSSSPCLRFGAPSNPDSPISRKTPILDS